LNLLYSIFLGDTQLAREGILNQDPIDAMLREHRAGKADHGNRLWLLVNSEVWYQMFIQGRGEEQLMGQIAERSRARNAAA
jgi:asparagine synthase (glutamine-hydrolysing)